MTKLSDQRAKLLARAQLYWDFSMDMSKANPPLKTIGKVEMVDSQDGGAVKLTDGYFETGGKFTTGGPGFTFYLRLRMPDGNWNCEFAGQFENWKDCCFKIVSNQFGKDVGIVTHLQAAADTLSQLVFEMAGEDLTAWHDMVMVYDGKTVQLVFDDRVVAKQWFAGGQMQACEVPLRIGSIDGIGRFNGLIQYTALWDKALSLDEIAVLNRFSKINPGNKLNEPNHDSPVHFRPGGLRIYGDANPFYHDGKYHVFYDSGPIAGPLRWEHIVSEDLIHWQELPRAIDVGPKGSPDENTTGSGTVVFDKKTQTYHLFYTGFNSANESTTYKQGRGHPDGGQQIMHAISKDASHWTKRPEDTFIGDGIMYHNIHQGPFVCGNHACRDPYVWWREDKQHWEMIFAAETAKVTGQQKLVYGRAVSTDLYKWKQITPLKTGDLLVPGRSVDCPDLFEINGRWYLIRGISVYNVAEQPEGPFGPDRFFDTDIHAVPKRMWDGKRQVLVGWPRDLAGFNDAGRLEWGGTQSIPRQMYTDDEGNLLSKPVDAVTAVYSKTVLDIAQKCDIEVLSERWIYDNGVLFGGTGQPWQRSRCALEVPDNYMLTATFDLEQNADLVITLRGQDDGRGYNLVIKPAGSEIEINSEYLRFPRKCIVDTSKPIDVQIFVQGSMLECFVDGQAFSMRAFNYPKGKLILGVECGRVQITDLKVNI